MYHKASLVAQLVKNPPAIRETWVQSLGWDDPLETRTATHSSILGLPWWLSWYRIRLQFGRPGFNPWVRKIPWRRARVPTPVFWPGEFHGLYSPWGHKESDMTEQLSLHFISGSRQPLEAGAPRLPVGGRRPGGVAKDGPSPPGPAWPWLSSEPTCLGTSVEGAQSGPTLQ